MTKLNAYVPQKIPPNILLSSLGKHAESSTKKLQAYIPHDPVNLFLRNFGKYAESSTKNLQAYVPINPAGVFLSSLSDHATHYISEIVNTPAYSELAGFLEKLNASASESLAKITVLPQKSIMDTMTGLSQSIIPIKSATEMYRKLMPLKSPDDIFIDAIARLSIRSVQVLINPNADMSYLKKAAMVTGLLAASPLFVVGLLGKTAYDTMRKAASLSGVSAISDLAGLIANSPFRTISKEQREQEEQEHTADLEEQYGVSMKPPMFDDTKVTIIEDNIEYDGKGKRKAVIRAKSLLSAKRVINFDNTPGFIFASEKFPIESKHSGQSETFYGDNAAGSGNITDSGLKLDDNIEEKVKTLFDTSREAEMIYKKIRNVIADIQNNTKDLTAGLTILAGTSEENINKYIRNTTNILRKTSTAVQFINKFNDVQTSLGEIFKKISSTMQRKGSVGSNSFSDSLENNTAALVTRDMISRYVGGVNETFINLENIHTEFRKIRSVFATFSENAKKISSSTEFAGNKSDTMKTLTELQTGISEIYIDTQIDAVYDIASKIATKLKENSFEGSGAILKTVDSVLVRMQSKQN